MDPLVVRESTTRLHYESVQRAIAAMRRQMGQPLSLRSLARIGFASPYHFTRTFRSVTGLPPLAFSFCVASGCSSRFAPAYSQQGHRHLL